MPRTTCNELHTPRTRCNAATAYGYACVAEQRNNVPNAVARLPSYDRLHRGGAPWHAHALLQSDPHHLLRVQLCSSPGPSPPERMLTLEPEAS